jgi:multiple sugar transport system substrate-binding protein
MSVSSPSSRRWLAAAVVATTAVSLAACSSDEQAANGPVELTFQSWVPNIDRVVDAFNEAHDDVHVTLETVTAGPDGGYATMQSAVQAGNAADVAQIGYDAIPDFLINDALEDITEYVEGDADLFTEWQWQTGVFGGSVYSIPQASGPLGQFYRLQPGALDDRSRPAGRRPVVHTRERRLDRRHQRRRHPSRRGVLAEAHR